MRLLLDANLPRRAIGAIASLGHDVFFVRDMGLGGAPDSIIAARAIEDDAVLVTRDLDFADVRRYPPEQFAGLLMLRLADTAGVDEIVEVLRRFLGESDLLKHLRGRLAIVETDRVRFRPPV